MASVFDVLGDGSRRAILTQLVTGERSVGEIEHSLGLSQPSVSKHLKVLREAGLVEVRIDAQRRLYRLRAETLRELDDFLTPFRRFWRNHLDALERHLDADRPNRGEDR